MNFVGVMLNMIVDALPNLGSVIAIMICLPLTFGITNVSAITLLLGVYYGSIYGGSTAAVFIDTSGTPQSTATAFDGYPMARAGKPGKTISRALTASIFGGVFSYVILTFTAPWIVVSTLRFGSFETRVLILVGLTYIPSVPANNQLKRLAVGVLGLLLVCVDVSPFSAESRFTLDTFALNSGIDLVAVIVDVFAFSEALDRVERMRRETRMEDDTSYRVQFPSLGE